MRKLTLSAYADGAPGRGGDGRCNARQFLLGLLPVDREARSRTSLISAANSFIEVIVCEVSAGKPVAATTVRHSSAGRMTPVGAFYT